MKLKLKSMSEIDVDQYYEDWTDDGMRRALTINGDADISKLKAMLTEDELSAASLVRTAGKVDLPPLKIDSIHKSIDDGNTVVDISFVTEH